MTLALFQETNFTLNVSTFNSFEYCSPVQTSYTNFEIILFLWKSFVNTKIKILHFGD